MKLLFLFAFALLVTTQALAQFADSTAPAEVYPRSEFLPRGHLFEPLILDPLEAQTYVSILPAYNTEGKAYPGAIVPFAFGFAKPFWRRTTAPGRATEFVIDVASFTQFEVYQDAVQKKQRRQLMNTDYKVSFILNLQRGSNSWRFRLYHLSSHLGDDYLIRNQINYYTPNSVNYEVVDVTFSREINGLRPYAGLGIGLRKPTERKRLSAQAGFFYRQPNNRLIRLVGGMDVKFWEQTSFRPGIKAGAGFEIGRRSASLTFLAELYSGFRPYSQYEDQRVQWLGFGAYLNPL
ncbi:hypothetical protein GCM10023189_42450 [Nibrella saemangeumensis]|uniref:DUF1207 domain-containing protein n=1 Tax=Nibrella saemangeumensis TaxID=1084526 RepID=A0ABP8ND78_9BACT